MSFFGTMAATTKIERVLTFISGFKEDQNSAALSRVVPDRKAENNSQASGDCDERSKMSNCLMVDISVEREGAGAEAEAEEDIMARAEAREAEYLNGNVIEIYKYRRRAPSTRRGP